MVERVAADSASAGHQDIISGDRREFAVKAPDGYVVIFTEPRDDPPTCAAE
jgi:hypothetical protein